MNAHVMPLMDFRPAYWQLSEMERGFVDGFVKDIETIAERTGKRLLAVLQEPFPYELDRRALAMLAQPMVRAAVSQRVKEISDLTDISVYKTLKELTAIGYSNISDYITIDELGIPDIDLSKVSYEKMAAIKSFEVEDKPRGGRKVKFQLHDKMIALGHLMRYQGLATDDNEHWKTQERSVKPINNAIPANANDHQAAELYARTLAG